MLQKNNIITIAVPPTALAGFSLNQNATNVTKPNNAVRLIAISFVTLYSIFPSRDT